MSVSKYLFIVSMNVKTEYEDLFNEVYDDEHVPYLLKVPGVNTVSYTHLTLPTNVQV